MLAEAGAYVVIADVNESAGKAFAEGLGQRARFAHVDVTEENSVRNGLEAAR